MKPVAMRDSLLERLWEEMANDPEIFFSCADFGSPVLDKIRADYPDRFVNVGVAEQNLINVSVGLALEGFKVFVYAIAPFLTMRCYEQIRVSIALLSEVRPMNINLIGVGAGFSYVLSGPTHQLYEDITLMRALPNIRVLSPADHVASSDLVDICLRNKGPKYIRLDAQVLPVIYEQKSIDLYKGFFEHKSGDAICVVATGYMLHTALRLASDLQVNDRRIGVIDVFDLVNLNVEELLQLLSRYEQIVTMEEGFRGRGGLDSLVFNLCAELKKPVKVRNFGVEPKYRYEIGSREDIHEKVGIGFGVIRNELMKICNLRENDG